MMLEPARREGLYRVQTPQAFRYPVILARTARAKPKRVMTRRSPSPPGTRSRWFRVRKGCGSHSPVTSES
jgi:hypothetical protein